MKYKKTWNLGGIQTLLLKYKNYFFATLVLNQELLSNFTILYIETATARRTDERNRYTDKNNFIGGLILVIESINDFLKEKDNQQKSINANLIFDGRGLPQRLFYRGQSNDYEGSNNVASIFRKGTKKDGYTHEYSVTNEYMRRYANDFSNLENNFSRLSYMQHFGLPTRLLDVTTNALVALYFACQSNVEDYKTEGIVNMFISNKEQAIDNYTYYNSRSDTVEVLSTLALMDEVKKKVIYDNISSFNQKIDNLLREDKNCLYRKWYMDKIKQFPEGYYEQLPEEDKKIYNSLNDIYDCINQSYEVQCLYHDIKRDIGYFADLINFRTLLHPFFVEPSFNNNRLRAQSGFFLFEPYDRTSYTLKNIQDDINRKVALHNTNKESIKLIIPGNAKEKILKELDQSFEINQATLFPDKENVAQYIKNYF